MSHAQITNLANRIQLRIGGLPLSHPAGDRLDEIGVEIEAACEMGCIDTLEELEAEVDALCNS